MKTRESHFRRDAFGVVKVWADGRTEVCNRPDGKTLRCNSMREASQEARRLTLLESFYQFSQGAFEFRASIVATDERVARKPSLEYGTGFNGWTLNQRFEESLRNRKVNSFAESVNLI